jgi:capsular exopolysaccharide synthesis family protein
MSLEKAEINTTAQQSNELSIFIKKAFFHWPLYIIVAILSILGGYLYLRYTKPVYLSSGKIYIKDEKKGSRDLDALKELSLFSSSKVVENEMEIIRSPLLLQDVIKNNGFNIRYFVKGRVVSKEIYENLPINLQIVSDSAKVGNYLLDIDVKGSNLKVSYNDKEHPEQRNVINTAYNSPFFVGKDEFIIIHNVEADRARNTGYQVKVDSVLQLAYQKANEIKTSLVNKQASVFEVSYEDEVAKRAADLVNALLITYNQYTLKDKNQIAVNTINFIESRLASLGSELSTVERDVENFKKNRGITEIGESSKLVLEQVKDADQKLDEANIQLSIYNQIETYINNPSNTTPFTPVFGNVDQTLVSLINRYEELAKEKKRLSLSLQPSNPILQNLDAQIEDARNTVKSYISGYKRNAATARGGLQRKVNEIEGLINNIPGYERQYITLKRQQSVKEALYLYLLQKKEESAVSYASNTIDNKVISPAYVPNVPVSPRKSTIFSAFILAGFVLATIYLYLKYSLNIKTHTKKEVEKILGLPVVAEIFKQEDDKSSSHQTRSLLNEQMLNLRTNLKFLLNNVSGTPVILFTSSISGEGKTFLASNLGNSLTFNGKRVVLLELDLRKPKLSASFNINNSSGITNYLVGAETLEQITNKVPGTERLYLIPSGPIPPNPVELLESEKMKQLLNTLRQQYDYIIIDTAPIGLVTDAKSLAPFVDCVLFVTRFNFTPIPKLTEVADNLKTSSFKKIGVVFNSVVPGSSHSASTYGYGYGYNYGYGYLATERPNLKMMLKKVTSRIL